MTTLNQIREKNHGTYTSPTTGVPLYTARDVEDWLRQNYEETPEDWSPSKLAMIGRKRTFNELLEASK